MEASRLQSETPSALPPGTRLGEFELLGLLGVGGFGIVYLAFDHALEREVAVKEYMPASLAGRTETMHVSLRSQSDAETFALGLRSFVNEARLLARFDHPSLLKVLRFWEGNGTAYMAMPVMRGRTVKEVRLEMTGPPDEAWLRALLEPLLGAIDRLHSEGVYHRDIAPDNIQIEPGGHPVLLDFGAARRVIGDKSQTLTAILKPAYAPIEQYAEAGSVKQGPWTDIYALGATLHYLLLARPPAPATARAVHDDASLLTTQSLPGCSENFLHIVDWMLAPRPSDRPQSVAALREVLDGRALPPRRRQVVEAPSHWDRTVMLPSASAQTTPPSAAADHDDKTMVVPRAAPPEAPERELAAGSRVAGAAAAAAVPAALASVAGAPSKPAWERRAADAAPTPQPAAAAPRAPSKALPLGIGAGMLALAVAAVALWPRQPASVASAPAASAPQAVAAAPAVPLPAPSLAPPVAESAVATVVLPGAPPAGAQPRPPPESSAAAPSSTPPLVAAPAPATTAAVGSTAPGVTTAVKPATSARPVTTRPPPATATVAVPHYTPPAPSPEPARQQAVAAAPTPTTLAAEAPKPVQASPEGTCGGRNLLRYFVCMERECLRSEFSAHADCLKWRKDAKRE